MHQNTPFSRKKTTFFEKEAQSPPQTPSPQMPLLQLNPGYATECS